MPFRWSEEEGYRLLASAVIVQWMKDYERTLKKIKNGEFLGRDDYVNLRWTEMWECDFWCEVAGIKPFWLKQWTEKIKSQYDCSDEEVEKAISRYKKAIECGV